MSKNKFSVNDPEDRLLMCLIRCYMDMDLIDKVCEIAQVHEFSLMRKDLKETIENFTGESVDEAVRSYTTHTKAKQMIS